MNPLSRSPQPTAISKQLAELMNGGFKVASKEGVGSTFTFNVMLEHPSEVR